MKPPEPEFITIGSILSPFGNQGQLKVLVLTDLPERFSPASEIYIERLLMTISSTVWHKGKAIIKLKSINNYTEADKLRGKIIELPSSQVNPLPQGQYYHFQLIGLEVKTDQGEHLGFITDILNTGSNDVYIVKGNRRDILIPAVCDVIKSVDLENGCLVIEAIDGLITDRDSG